MNGIRLETLLAAHAALTEAWNLDYATPPPFTVRRHCMEAATRLKLELAELMPVVEVKAEPKADEPLRAVA